MKKILPKRLLKGDMIGLVAPSHALTADHHFQLKRAVEIIESLGFQVRYGKTIGLTDRYNHSAGSAIERAEDINVFFKDPQISAIWCVQGGETANMTLDLLDYTAIESNPKIFIGLSDITVLLNAIHHKTGLVTFHGPDPKAYPEDATFASKYSHEEFISRLQDGAIGPIRKLSVWKCVRAGKAHGPLIGGNLRCFLKLAGTPYLPNTKGAILLLENFHINIPEAQYMLTRLKHMGVFGRVSAVVVGYVYGFQHENTHIAQFEDILKDVSSEYDFPILKINEFGHRIHNTFLPIGAGARVDSEALTFELTEPFVI